MINRKKFKAYLNIQKSGLTNMFDLNAITFLSVEIYEVKLTWNDCLFIMNNYSQLREKYKEEIMI